MLELKNVAFNVPSENGDGAKDIIRDVSFTVDGRKLVVITGPNGGGKSTLAKLIMGIERPTGGKIYFDGKDITDLDVTERAKLGVGFAFQQPVRFKGLTVKDLLTVAAGRGLAVDDACVYLSEVGLCAMDYVNRELNSSFSGGELKRVEIAMAIARNTKLTIFDEPEAGIDLWSFHNLIRVFERTKELTEGSILIISHQERIIEIADEIIVVADGRIRQIGNKDEVMPGLLDTTDSCAYYRGA
jgi:Fe-S cluster assembly ATP-binding protein